MPGPDARRAYLLLTLAPLFWSGNFVLGRAMSTQIPPVTMAYWRWQTALLLLLPIAGAALWRQRTLVRAHWQRLLVLGILGVACFNTFVYLGLQTTTATNALLINSAIPIFIILLAVGLFREEVSNRNRLGVALSLAGVVYLVVRGEWRHLTELQLNPGDLWILAAALAWASYSV